jgi:hypothetical protein
VLDGQCTLVNLCPVQGSLHDAAISRPVVLTAVTKIAASDTRRDRDIGSTMKAKAKSTRRSIPIARLFIKRSSPADFDARAGDGLWHPPRPRHRSDRSAATAP